ncbi:MAG TPA: transporter substrate-binding domain-containing protein [Methyloceanibacter sp.]
MEACGTNDSWGNLRLGATLIVALGVLLSPLVAKAQVRNEIVPDVWQGAALRPKPDLGGLQKLRFVTDSDYPPFHYFDEEGVLTGFNVDLAKSLCEALNVECEVRAVDWDELFTGLDTGEADAAIASIRISEESLNKADFTERYYATPARFIAKKDNALKDIIPETLNENKVGVVKGTGHEAYLKQFFPGATLVEFDTAEGAQAALKKGDVEFVFGDGIGLTFWLNGVTSDGCCEFRGGPYLDAKFFGEGVGIAVRKGNRQLTEILDYALEQVHASGRYEELFLRYFPMSFF